MKEVFFPVPVFQNIISYLPDYTKQNQVRLKEKMIGEFDELRKLYLEFKLHEFENYLFNEWLSESWLYFDIVHDDDSDYSDSDYSDSDSDID